MILIFSIVDALQPRQRLVDAFAGHSWEDDYDPEMGS